MPTPTPYKESIVEKIQKLGRSEGSRWSREVSLQVKKLGGDQWGLQMVTVFLSVSRTLEASVGGLWVPGDRVGNLGAPGNDRRLSGI